MEKIRRPALVGAKWGSCHSGSRSPLATPKMIKTKLLRVCSLSLQRALTMEEKATYCPCLSKKTSLLYSQGWAERGRVFLFCPPGSLLVRPVAQALDQESPKSWNEAAALPLRSQGTRLVPPHCSQERDCTPPREPLGITCTISLASQQ